MTDVQYEAVLIKPGKYFNDFESKVNHTPRASILSYGGETATIVAQSSDIPGFLNLAREKEVYAKKINHDYKSMADALSLSD
jgi:hypothetical protein